MSVRLYWIALLGMPGGFAYWDCEAEVGRGPITVRTRVERSNVKSGSDAFFTFISWFTSEDT
jgi:hypothetical protein